MLKKMILALSTSFLLLTGATGCSFVKDTVNAVSIAEDMNKVVTQANKNTEIYEKADAKVREFDKLVGDGSALTPELVKKAQPLLDEAKKDAVAYSEAVKKVQAELPKLKEAATKFDDAETKKLADQFVSDFEKSTQLEVQFSAAQEEYIAINEKFLKAFVDGKELDAKEFNAVLDKYNGLSDQFASSIEQFNKSWKEFNTKVTGDKVK